MKKVGAFSVCVVFVAAALLSGCGCFKHTHEEQLAIVNVLDPDLYNDCHIDGSINVPFEQLEHFVSHLDPDTHVVLYCSNYKCTASIFGARMLKKMGFTHVWAYEAGIAGWYQQKLPIVGPAQQAYLTMENKPLEGESEKELLISTQELQQKMKTLKLYRSAPSCCF